jgi:hypothetical protein
MTHAWAIMRSTPTIHMAAFVFMATTLGQPAPPTTGYQLGGPVLIGSESSGSEGPWVDVIMPFTVAQCEPVPIYYNMTAWTKGGAIKLYFSTPTLLVSDNQGILYIEFPSGSIGYYEWICNIPASEGFVVNVEPLYIEPDQYYLVQPGSSSACLGPLTVTYGPYLQYATAEFASYTTQSFPSFTTLWAPVHIPYVFAIFWLSYS